MYRTLVVPLDGSKLAERALEQVSHVAEPGAHVYLLRVIQPSQRGLLGEEELSRFDRARIEGARHYLAQVAARISGFTIEPEVLAGHDPAAAIAGFARRRNAEVIIMSTHGESGLARYVFGSVASKLLQLVSCPVLVVRPVGTPAEVEEEIERELRADDELRRLMEAPPVV